MTVSVSINKRDETEASTQKNPWEEKSAAPFGAIDGRESLFNRKKQKICPKQDSPVVFRVWKHMIGKTSV